MFSYGSVLDLIC